MKTIDIVDLFSRLSNDDQKAVMAMVRLIVNDPGIIARQGGSAAFAKWFRAWYRNKPAA